MQTSARAHKQPQQLDSQQPAGRLWPFSARSVWLLGLYMITMIKSVVLTFDYFAVIGVYQYYTDFKIWQQELADALHFVVTLCSHNKQKRQ